jgi:hypothetical protein
MVSSTTLQDISQTVHRTTGATPPDFEVLRSSIYDITMHAFLNEVLTLERMCSVIQAVCMGVAHNTNAPTGGVADTQVLARRGAYQGLCTAAGLGLTAAGLAFTQFSQFHGTSLPAGVGRAMVDEALALKQQIDQVTRGAGWLSNGDVTQLQARAFEQLFRLSRTQTQRASESSISWAERVFRDSEYQALHATSQIRASLMLLGLLTSGVLTGLRASQAAA